MARLIIKNGYMKGGGKKTAHLVNLVQYIATRDGVEKVSKQNPDQPSTTPQKKLIDQLIHEFPDCKNSFEYADYMAQPTMGNARDFITNTMEQLVSQGYGREKYLDYIANRPRVEILDGHGLFSATKDKIVLSKVAEEVAKHKGNIWTPILSLHRSDAVLTEFESADMWRDLLSAKAIEIAQSLQIDPDHFKWYAAFHNESHHPHVHMICYSTNPNEGYLDRKGIESMKSTLVHEIFKEQLHQIYLQKDVHRAELKQEAEKALQELKSKLQVGNCYNPQLELLMVDLQKKLKSVTGKKQYGYLRPPLKAIINQIVDELAHQPDVATAFEKWQELQDELYSSYQDTKPIRLPLSQQKEFKSIKNMVIREVVDMELEMKIPEPTPSMKTAEEPIPKSDPEPQQTQEPAPPKVTPTQRDTWKNPAVGTAVLRLFKHMEGLFNQNLPQDNMAQHQRIDSKTMQLLREKKRAQGLKISTLDEQQDFHQQQY